MTGKKKARGISPSRDGIFPRAKSNLFSLSWGRPAAKYSPFLAAAGLRISTFPGAFPAVSSLFQPNTAGGRTESVIFPGLALCVVS